MGIWLNVDITFFLEIIKTNAKTLAVLVFIIQSFWKIIQC